jgi:hypothetical protein
MTLSLKQQFTRHLLNYPGATVNKKIVVLESDDWGSIRIPSKKVYQQFIQKGYGVENSAYNRYDALESETDLIALFEVLQQVKDKNNQSAILTANTILANPDFEAIRNSDFRQYHYQLVSATIKEYPEHNNIIQLWKQGMEAGIYQPQCHGREHLHIGRWMKRLQKADADVRYCFDMNTTFSGDGKTDYSFMEAFDFDGAAEISSLQQILADGLEQFKAFFGFASTTFIAPCYTWHAALEPIMVQHGVEYIQGNIVQLQPPMAQGKYKKTYHYTGQKSAAGARYLVRNCIFEPTLNPGIDSVNTCLQHIDIAFKRKKPAIICTHRLNYIGYLDEANRARNLSQLKELLQAIVKKWPEVEFMSSNQLGHLLSQNK